MTLQMMKRIWKDEAGQDLVEYTLLLAFVTLVAAGMFVNVGQNISAIWSKANTHITAANTAAQ